MKMNIALVRSYIFEDGCRLEIQSTEARIELKVHLHGSINSRSTKQKLRLRQSQINNYKIHQEIFEYQVISSSSNSVFNSSVCLLGGASITKIGK